MENDFNQIAGVYSKKAGRFNSFFIKRKSDILLDLLKKYLSNYVQASGLDIGCGIGLAEQNIGGNIELLVGVDTSSNMIKIAKSKKSKNNLFIVGSALNLPLKGEIFDFTFSFGLMHHLVDSSDYEKLIKESIRVTKNKGIFITFDHNSFNFLTRLIVSMNELDKNIKKLTNVREIKKIYNKTGIKTLESKSIIFAPNKWLDIIFTKLLSRFELVGGQFYIVGRVHH
jgi:SAM-dependent methyltransferase